MRFQLNIEAERAHFLDQTVEAFGDTCFEAVITFDDRFVNFGTTDDVIGFDRQHFLQGISSAIGLQCPAFHFPETLAAELRLTTQWLLRNKAVRSDRTGVDLVINKVMQLKHVNDAHGNLAVEHVAGASVEQVGLA